MSDTCIVCLGDLHAPDQSPVASVEGSTDHTLTATTTTTTAATSLTTTATTTAKSPSLTDPDSYIAHILPCGHNLHDSCLRPWVERANSCPICRTTFHMVELRQTLHGPTVSSYIVEDKAQVADVDPSAYLDDDAEAADDNIQPCMVCDTFGDESLLLLCDGCNQSCHVFCAGLDVIPTGAWFCYDCQSDPQVWVHPRPSTSISRAASDRTARSRARGARARNNTTDNRTTWARLWRSVASRTDIDLEFPFADDSPIESARVEAEQQEFREWQSRFQIAARAAGPGAANRFRVVAPPNQTIPSNPESQEEIKAWNALEKARILLEDTDGRANKKRKSRNSSAEVEQRPVEPSRRRKRPRTLRNNENESAAETRPPPTAEPSRPISRNPSIAMPDALRVETGVGPSFLQSLLEEVDHVAVSRDGMFYDVNGEVFPFGTERSISPDCASPTSGQASPQSTTPTPLRPLSPPQLTSLISPIFPPAPEFLPDSKPQPDNFERARARQRAHLSPRSPATSPSRPESSAAPSSPTSAVGSPKPSASNTSSNKLDLKTKTEVQGLVKSVLKPHYKKRIIDASQYTEINRRTCHKLYQQVGNEENFTDQEHWQAVAKEEVDKALKALKTSKEPEPKPIAAEATEITSVNATTALPIRGS